jgi:hypothetical protein
MSKADDRCITPCPKAADPSIDPHEWDHTPLTGGASFVCRKCGQETTIGNWQLPPIGYINWAPGWGPVKEEFLWSVDSPDDFLNSADGFPDEALVLPHPMPPELVIKLVSGPDEYGRRGVGCGPTDLHFWVINKETYEVVGELVNVAGIKFSIGVDDALPHVELDCVGVGFDLSLGATMKWAMGSANPVLRPVPRVVQPVDPYHMCTGMGYGEHHRCTPPFYNYSTGQFE